MIASEICFLKVPLPWSRQVVARLQELPCVMTAAAVYGAFDVVAVFTDTQAHIDEAHAEIETKRKSGDLPIDDK